MPILQSPGEFLKDFISYIEEAKSSVMIQTMNFESGMIMDQLEPVLINAVKRKVSVHLVFDWVAQRFIHGELPIFPSASSKKREYASILHKKNIVMRERLEKAGIKMTVTNIPSLVASWVPPVGRNHIKMYIVDEKVAWMGGVNLFDDAFENVDIMVKFTAPEIVTPLLKQFYKVNENRRNNDYSINCTPAYSLYVDTGKKGKSIIYKRACESIERALENVIFMSQFVPDGPLLQAIIGCAKRNISVTVITSFQHDFKFTRFPEKIPYILFRNAIKKYPLIRFIHLPKRVHAKLLLIDGNRALFGSHNYAYAGVLGGTEEIMLETTDKEMLTQLNALMTSLMYDYID